MPPNTQGSVNVLVNPVVNTQAWNRVAKQFPLGKISADLNQFQASLDASVARTGAFAISAGALGGTARIIRDLAASFLEVQKTLIEINSIFGLSDRAIKGFGKELFNIARQTASSFTDVASAAQEFARQGLSITETAKRTADAMTLAKLSGIDAGEAVQTLTAAVNGFSKEALTTTQIVDKLATVDAAFAVSTQDLAAGLSRVGDVAQGAGVSMDQLLASVTAVQQRTSRGGAVIGNGLKSIFTRLQRSTVRESLESLGVSTQNASGEFRGAIPILQEYANKYKTLTDAQRAFADEQIAGVYQINTLKALLSDLGSQYGSFESAVTTAGESSGSAARRLAELATSTSALVSRTGSSLKELGALAGEDLLGPTLTRTLTIVDKFSKDLSSKLSGEDVTAFGRITKRVFEDLGNYIAGPGLATGILLIGTLFKQVGSDAFKALQGVARSITGLQKYKDVEESISQTIRNNIDLQKKLAAVKGNRVAEEQIILSYLRQQVQATADLVTLQSRTIPNIAAKAQFSGKGRRQEVVGYKAGGYVNTSLEQAMIDGGVGGAKKGDKPRVIKNFNYGGGKRGTVVANTGEYYVPSFGGGSAIFNRDMVKQYGLPEGAKKISAAGGFIPGSSGMDPKDYAKNLWENEIPKYLETLKSSGGDPKLIKKISDAIDENQFGVDFLTPEQKARRKEVTGSFNKYAEQQQTLAKLRTSGPTEVEKMVAGSVGKGSVTAGYQEPKKGPATQAPIVAPVQELKKETVELNTAAKKQQRAVKVKTDAVKAEAKAVVAQEKTSKKQIKAANTETKAVKVKAKNAVATEKVAKQEIISNAQFKNAVEDQISEGGPTIDPVPVKRYITRVAKNDYTEAALSSAAPNAPVNNISSIKSSDNISGGIENVTSASRYGSDALSFRKLRAFQPVNDFSISNTLENKERAIEKIRGGIGAQRLSLLNSPKSFRDIGGIKTGEEIAQLRKENENRSALSEQIKKSFENTPRSSRIGIYPPKGIGGPRNLPLASVREIRNNRSPEAQAARNLRAKELLKERAQAKKERARAKSPIRQFFSKNQTALGAAAFLGPSILGGLFSNEQNESTLTSREDLLGQRKKRGYQDIFTQTLQGGVTGGALAGPYGAAAGAAAGLTISLVKLIKSTDELSLKQTVAQNRLSKINTEISATEVVRGSKQKLNEAFASGNKDAIFNAQEAYVESLTLAAKEINGAAFSKLSVANTDEDFGKIEKLLKVQRAKTEAEQLSIAAAKSEGKDYGDTLSALVNSSRGLRGGESILNFKKDGRSKLPLLGNLAKDGFNFSAANKFNLVSGGGEKDITEQTEESRIEIKKMTDFLGSLSTRIPELSSLTDGIENLLNNVDPSVIEEGVKKFSILFNTLKLEDETVKLKKQLDELYGQERKATSESRKLAKNMDDLFDSFKRGSDSTLAFREDLIGKASSNISLLQDGGLVAPSVGDQLTSRYRQEQGFLSSRPRVNDELAKAHELIGGLPNLGKEEQAIKNRALEIATANPKDFAGAVNQLKNFQKLIDGLGLMPEQLAELKAIAANIEGVNSNTKQSLEKEEEFIKSQARFAELVAKAQSSKSFGASNLESDQEAIRALKDKTPGISAALGRKDAFSQLFNNSPYISGDLKQRLEEKDRKTGILGRLSSLAGRDITGLNSEKIKSAISDNAKGLDKDTREAVKVETLGLMEEFGKDYTKSFTVSLKSVLDQEIEVRSKFVKELSETNTVKPVPNAASGYVSVKKERDAIKRGVGGAKSGDKPYIISKFNYGNGRRGPIVANTGEKHIKGSGADSILNRDMMNAAGGIDKLDEYEEILAGMKNFPEITAKRDAYESSNPKAREARIRKENLAKNPDYYSPLDLDLGDFKNLPGAEGAVAAKKAREDARAKAEFTNKATSAAFDSIDLGNFKNLPGSAEARAKKEASLTKKQIEEQKRAANIKLNPDYYKDIPQISDDQFTSFIKDPKNDSFASNYFKEQEGRLSVMKPESGATQDQINKYYDEVARVNKIKDQYTASKNDRASSSSVKREVAKINKPSQLSPEFLKKYGKYVGTGSGGTRVDQPIDLSKYRSSNKGTPGKPEIGNLGGVRLGNSSISALSKNTIVKDLYAKNPNEFKGTKVTSSLDIIKNSLLDTERTGKPDGDSVTALRNQIDSVSRADPAFAKSAPFILDSFKNGDRTGAKQLFENTEIKKEYDKGLERRKNNQDYNASLNSQFSFLNDNKDPVAAAAGLPKSANQDKTNKDDLAKIQEKLAETIEKLNKELEANRGEVERIQKQSQEAQAKFSATIAGIVAAIEKSGLTVNTKGITVTSDGQTTVNTGGGKVIVEGGDVTS